MTWFSNEQFEEERRRQRVTWGRPVRVLDVTESTNDLALAAVGGSDRTGIVWIAQEQTAGRGRRGNTWIARPGECLMFSTLIRLPSRKQSLSGLSLAVGLALRDACQPLVSSSGPPLAIKWPNDLMAGDEKLAGILIESRSDPNGGVGVVIGIGLNVSGSPDEGSSRESTCLATLGGTTQDLRLESLLARILGRLEVRVARFFSKGLGSMGAELQEADYLFGRGLDIDGRRGVAAGIDEGGHLILKGLDSRELRITSGHVTVIAP